MANYLASIDLEDEHLSAGVIEKTVQMATGVPGAKVYLMTVIPGISPGIVPLYAVRGEMHGSAEYPLQQWKDDAAKVLQEIFDKKIPKEMHLFCFTIKVIGIKLPPVFGWWRDFAASYVGGLCLGNSDGSFNGWI